MSRFQISLDLSTGPEPDSKKEGEAALAALVRHLMQVILILKGWEDPDWGHSAIGQINVISVIQEMAIRVADAEIRRELESVVEKAMARAAEKLISR